MSVKVHEAFSLDSARRRYLFEEHFLGDSLRDIWRSTGDAGGSAVVVDAQDGGIVRITTDGDNADSWSIDWGNIRSLHVDKKVTVEFRAKVASASDLYISLNLSFDAGNRVCFVTSGADVRIRCANGGAATTVNGQGTFDTDWHIYRIECFPTDEVHFYIDGVETAGSPITTNIPSDAADYLEPWVYILNAADASKTLDIDYVVIRQER